MIKRYFSRLALLLFIACTPFLIKAQTVLEGVLMDAKGQVIQQPAKVSVFELPSQILRGETETRPDGHFVFELPAGKYQVLAVGDLFFENHDTVTLGKEKVFLKMNVRRRPGQIIAQENLEEKNRQQKTKSTRLKEANNSVPLPELTPNNPKH